VTGTAGALARVAAKAAGAELSRATPTQKVATPALINATNEINRFQRTTLLLRIPMRQSYGDSRDVSSWRGRDIGETRDALIVDAMLCGLDASAIVGVTDP
jgi:hypothetical protein